jgi:peptidyl-prolyl cis-trans isomerase C
MVSGFLGTWRRFARRSIPPAMAARVGFVASFLGALALSGCDEKALEKTPPSASASARPGALSPELASKVLARIGDKTITLGDYSATLDRMDQFERLRYQSPERRKQLLDEIIKAELLAAEARRRGLDREPETRERIRQILRDELLRDARDGLPPPAAIPESEVRAYYDRHRQDFSEPERRRVAVIALGSAEAAKRVLERAKKATPAQWGQLVHEHSLDKSPKPSPTSPLELSGDLGIVGPPGHPRGENPRVPRSVGRAVFEIAELGGVHKEVVEADGKHYVVRMTGKTDARDRSLAEAERTIRVAILQERIRQAEQKLEQDLRKKYPVKIDEAALSKVEVPSRPAP